MSHLARSPSDVSRIRTSVVDQLDDTRLKWLHDCFEQDYSQGPFLTLEAWDDGKRYLANHSFSQQSPQVLPLFSPPPISEISVGDLEASCAPHSGSKIGNENLPT